MFSRPMSFATAFIMSLGGFTAHAQSEPRVVVSIKPVHSLVSAVMEGVSVPELLITGSQSPHGFALKPSQAAALQDATLVFWIGEELETSLKKPIETIAAESRNFSFMDANGIKLLDYRSLEQFSAKKAGHDDHDDHAEDKHDDHDDHAEHKHDDHDDHAEDKHDDHDDHAEHKHDDHDDHAEHKHDDHEGHDHAGSKDAHIWLDPKNAGLMVQAIVAKLSTADVANEKVYRENGAKILTNIEALSAEITPVVEALKDSDYVVFHDAYQYFETSFGLSPTGVISINPETRLSAARMKELRATIKKENVSCVFSEPQFNSSIVNTLIEGTSIRTSTLDPLGAGLEPGPNLYGDLIKNMAISFRDCLSPTG